MVQYDQFAPLLVNTDLPARAKEISLSGRTTPSLVDSPVTLDGSQNITFHPRQGSPTTPHSRKESSPNPDSSQVAVHSQLRRLSSSHVPHDRYCSKCHMRRPSQELLFAQSDATEDFCPDIVMPKSQRPTTHHHARRHSGLCPDNVIAHELSEGIHSPTQITLKSRLCRHSSSSSATGYHHDCQCENVTPVENLSARYGQIEEPAQNLARRRSTEKEAMDLVHEIMHEEMLADMEAKQSRL